MVGDEAIQAMCKQGYHRRSLAKIYVAHYKQNFGVRYEFGPWRPTTYFLRLSYEKAIYRFPEKTMFPICETYFSSTFESLFPPRSECLDSPLVGAASDSAEEV